LSFSLPFFAILLGFAIFRAFYWLFAIFLLDDPLKLFLAFWVLDSNFKLCAFVFNGLIKGEIEKLSGMFLGLIVMSH
jgi:hypothetical protein